MRNLEVVLVQADQVWEDKLANCANYERLLENCGEADLIILPEMFHTGFSMDTENLAEDWNVSAGKEWLLKMSKAKNAAFYTSLIIEENGKFFNRGVFVTPDGKIEHYDKRKLFGLGGEDRFFEAGKEQKIVNYKGWNINLQICYDLRFPEISRNRLNSNLLPDYDVTIYVANWPLKRILHWKTLLLARAIENQCFVLGVNRVGRDGKALDYSGNSMVATGLGLTIEPEVGTECILRSTLNKDELDQLRQDLPFLKD